MKQFNILYRVCLAVPLLLTLVSCETALDDTDPIIDTFEVFSYSSAECVYVLSAHDEETAIKSIRVYKNNVLLVSYGFSQRSEVDKYGLTVYPECNFTNDGFIVKAVVEDFAGNSTEAFVDFNFVVDIDNNVYKTVQIGN